jgi:hypothetical protein
MKFIITLTDNYFDKINQKEDIKKLEKIGFVFEEDSWDIELVKAVNIPTIKFKNLNEFMAFVKEFGAVVLGSNAVMGDYKIEIYNGYRE